MYRNTLEHFSKVSNLEKLRKQSFDLMREIYIAVEGIPRQRDQRYYRSRCMYVYNNQLKDEGDFITLIFY